MLVQASSRKLSPMALVSYTPHLRRFFPELESEEVAAADVAELVRALEARHRGLSAYLVEEDGTLRKHVNIFVDGDPLRDRKALTDPLTPTSTVHVLQALSGG